MILPVGMKSFSAFVKKDSYFYVYNVYECKVDVGKFVALTFKHCIILRSQSNYIFVRL